MSKNGRVPKYRNDILHFYIMKYAAEELSSTIMKGRHRFSLFVLHLNVDSVAHRNFLKFRKTDNSKAFKTLRL